MTKMINTVPLNSTCKYIFLLLVIPGDLSQNPLEKGWGGPSLLLGPALFLWLGGLGFGIAEAEEDSIELFRVRSWSCSCSTPSTDTRLLGPDFFILEFISPIYRSPKVFEVSRRLIKSSIGVKKRAAVFVNPRVKSANERKKTKSQETSEPFPFCFLFQKGWLVGW